MHGIIHLELQNFVTERYGADALRAVCAKAGLVGEIYTPLRSYPDAQIVKLVSAAQELTKTPAAALLESFGEFLAPRYLALYGKLLKPEWRTLDVIEHTEATIHRVVRLRQPEALPPRLQVKRTSKDSVTLTYDSPRKLCAVARGIARGIATHFGEHLSSHEDRCMLRGDSACVIVFQRVARPA